MACYSFSEQCRLFKSEVARVHTGTVYRGSAIEGYIPSKLQAMPSKSYDVLVNVNT